MIVISAVAHVVLLVLFGSWTVYQYVAGNEAQFDEPPPDIEEVPPPENVEVTIQKQRSQDTQQREIRMQPVANIAVPELQMETPDMADNFSVTAGVGGGLGGMSLGGGLGGVGLGVSQINVFGLRDEGERILFVVDAGGNMMTDDRGGMNTYNAVKEELVRIAGTLAPGSLFNVMTYDSFRPHINRFSPDLIPATPENVNRLREWIEPINSNPSNFGPGGNNVSPNNIIDHPVGDIIANHGHRSNSRMRMLNVVLEQDVDLVYLITDRWPGFTNLRRPPTERERQEWQRYRESDEFKRASERFNAAMPRVREQVEAAEKRDNEQRARRGLPPRVFASGTLRAKANHYGIAMPSSPASDNRYHEPGRNVEEYFRQVILQEYRRKGRTVPRINMIQLLAEDAQVNRDEINSIRNSLRHFRNGRVREVRGLAAIRSHVESDS